MKTRHGFGLGLVGLAASTFAFAAEPVASQVTDENCVTAQAYDRLVTEEAVMEEIIVTARHPNAKAKDDEISFPVAIDLTNTPIHSTDLAQSFMFEPEIRLNL